MKLNRGQRVVLVIGWGLVLATVAAGLSAAVAPRPFEDGWFNYAPNAGVLWSSSSGTSPSDFSWASTTIWLGAVVLWVGGSLLLLRAPRPSSDS